MKATNVQPPQQTHGVGEQAHHLVEDIAQRGIDQAQAVTARLLQTLSAARGRLSSLGSEVSGKARQAATATDQYVHERPWQALGVGAAVGLLVGILIARRR